MIFLQICEQVLNYYLKTACGSVRGLKEPCLSWESCISCTADAPEQVWIVSGASIKVFLVSTHFIGLTLFHSLKIELSTTWAQMVPLLGTTIQFFYKRIIILDIISIQKISILRKHTSKRKSWACLKVERAPSPMSSVSNTSVTNIFARFGKSQSSPTVNFVDLL